MALCLAVLPAGCTRQASDDASTAEVTRGTLTVWTPFEGTLESRTLETIASHVQGRATIVDLAPEGATVRHGDLLVRFDDSQLTADAVRLENDAARAEADLDALEHAEIPLARRDAEAEVADLRRQLETEQSVWVDSQDLAGRKLIPEREVDQGRRRVEALRERLAQSEQRLDLMEKHAHPAKLARARAEVVAARAQLAQVRLQMTNCVIRAAGEGLLVYLPLYTGNEYRPVRIGDAVFPGQPFLALPDLSNLVVQVYVPESDLGRVRAGMAARVVPLAFPECRLAGTVESLGPAAQARPGFPAWQRYVRATVRLDESDPRLRPGMSLQAEVQTYHHEGAVLVPRAAVRWDDGTAVCRVRGRTGAQDRRLSVGPGDASQLEVLDGLKPGERVACP